MEFTKEQLDNYKSYERVRMEGRWNMFDPNARFCTGLEKDEYMFVVKNYTELKKAVENNKNDEEK